MTIDPEMLMAYADAELDELAAKRVERAIAEDPELARQVEAHRALKARIAGHFAPVTEEPVPDRLSAMLQSNVVGIEAAKTGRDRPRWMFSAPNWAAIAATLVVGLVVGQAVDLNPTNVGERGGVLVAQGPLKTALETQLASAPLAGAETRVALTFRDKAGAVCRTFEQQRIAGIACRAGDDWQVRQMMGAAGSQADYRQAGSIDVLAAAEPMMAEGPFDADTERAARDGGWK